MHREDPKSVPDTHFEGAAGEGDAGSSAGREFPVWVSAEREKGRKGLERRCGNPWTQRQVAAILARGGFYREGKLRYGEATGQNKRLASLGGGVREGDSTLGPAISDGGSDR